MRHSRLKCEYDLAKTRIYGHVMKGIPKIIYFGKFQNQNVLVMEQLGLSLEHLFNKQRKRYKKILVYKLFY